MKVLLYLIAVIAVVGMWRGLDGLMNVYLFPKNRLLSYWVSFLTGFVIMVIVLFVVLKE